MCARVSWALLWVMVLSWIYGLAPQMARMERGGFRKTPPLHALGFGHCLFPLLRSGLCRGLSSMLGDVSCFLLRYGWCSGVSSA